MDFQVRDFCLEYFNLLRGLGFHGVAFGCRLFFGVKGYYLGLFFGGVADGFRFTPYLFDFLSEFLNCSGVWVSGCFFCHFLFK